MKILFMHNNFPAQYRRIYKYLAKMPDVRMAVATRKINEQRYNLPTVRFEAHREPRENAHPAIKTPAKGLLMGQAAMQALYQFKNRGHEPDIVLSHSGWGSSLFVKDLFPDAKFLSYFEWYYLSQGSDGDFFRDGEAFSPDQQMQIRMKNTAILHDLAAMDWGQCPTTFQHSKFPERFRNQISVLHDGVDTDFFKPNENVRIQVSDGKYLTKDDEVISYIARGMEEYRGFPQFMEAVSKLQKVRPNLHVVILGRDRVAYGNKRKDGRTFKTWALETFEFDMERLHFMDLQPLAYLRDLVRITKAHIYLTAPFVLSWSLLETMCAGALVVGSDTEPVRELIKHKENGLLVDFFNTDDLVETLNKVLDNPKDYDDLRKAGRQTILDKYSINDILPKQWQLIQNVANGSQINPD